MWLIGRAYRTYAKLRVICIFRLKSEPSGSSDAGGRPLDSGAQDIGSSIKTQSCHWYTYLWPWTATILSLVEIPLANWIAVQVKSYHLGNSRTCRYVLLSPASYRRNCTCEHMGCLPAFFPSATFDGNRAGGVNRGSGASRCRVMHGSTICRLRVNPPDHQLRLPVMGWATLGSWSGGCERLA